MAYCDSCGNFDKSYLEDGGFNDEWNEIRKKSDTDYQPDLYYYWDDYFDEIVEEIKGGQSINDLH